MNKEEQIIILTNKNWVLEGSGEWRRGWEDVCRVTNHTSREIKAQDERLDGRDCLNGKTDGRVASTSSHVRSGRTDEKARREDGPAMNALDGNA